jgi:hypothetical protein
MASYADVLAAFDSLQDIADALRSSEQSEVATKLEQCVSLIRDADNARIQQVADIVFLRQIRQRSKEGRALDSIHMLMCRVMARPDKFATYVARVVELCEQNGCERVGVLRDA